MTETPPPGGVAHALPDDLRGALEGEPAALATWRDITPGSGSRFRIPAGQPQTPAQAPAQTPAPGAQ